MAKDAARESQKNVPIDESYHRKLLIIAALEGTSMKATVQKWIDEDGRGNIKDPGVSRKKQRTPEAPAAPAQDQQTAPGEPAS